MLGLRFSRLVHAAIASGALSLGACPNLEGHDNNTEVTATVENTSIGDVTSTETPTTGSSPDEIPPALVAVEFLDQLTLQLTFTKPMAPVDMVDPKSFRLGLAIGLYDFEGNNVGTKLYSPEYFNPGFDCPPPYEDYSCDYSPSELVLVLDAINHPSHPKKILLNLSEKIRPSLCSFINADIEDQKPVLHIHYAADEMMPIADLDGLLLPPLAGEWVNIPGDFASYDGRPSDLYNPFLPIPCPF